MSLTPRADFEELRRQTKEIRKITKVIEELADHAVKKVALPSPPGLENPIFRRRTWGRSGIRYKPYNKTAKLLTSLTGSASLASYELDTLTEMGFNVIVESNPEFGDKNG